jgi:predicted nucleic acid-binding protein
MVEVIAQPIRLRIVLDTDVLVAVFQSAVGASRALLPGALRGAFVLPLSTALLIEQEAVLTRPAILARAGASARDITVLLDDLAGLCHPVPLDFRWRPLALDVGDDHLLGPAINGAADVIATFNLRHVGAAANGFGIGAMRPSAVLDILSSRAKWEGSR